MLFIAKDVKRCIYRCYVRSATLVVRIGRMPSPETGATHFHAQLGRPSKGCATKWVGCLLRSMARINDLWDCFLDERKVRSLVHCCGQDINRALVPPQPIDSYKICYNLVAFVKFWNSVTNTRLSVMDLNELILKVCCS